MFLKAVIDDSHKLSEQQARFASILEFVADDCDSGIFYFFKAWGDRMATQQSTEDFHPNQPRLVYFSNREYVDNGEGWNALPIHVPTNEFVYSNSGIVCKGALEQQGLNATTALLTLAVAGVGIVLPNVSFSRKSVDEIQDIRTKLLEEREQYLGVVSEIADDALGRLTSGEFRGTYEWARNEATLKILPKARRLQSQLTKLDRSLLHRAGYQFWTEGIPAIGKALVSSGKDAAIRAAAEEIIRVVAVTLAKRIEERKIPEAVYTLKLSNEISAD